jgi:uncharacterized repeat protein (TIGR02059 family)
MFSLIRKSSSKPATRFNKTCTPLEFPSGKYRFNLILVIALLFQTLPFLSSSANASTYTTGSAQFGSNWRYLSAANGGDFAVGTGAFTVEWWQFMTSPPAGDAGINSWPRVFFVDGAFQLSIEGSLTSPTVYLWLGGGAIALGNLDNFSTTNQNQWVHFALTRSGTSLRFFVNGTQLGLTRISTSNITNTSSPLIIGAQSTDSRTQFPGRITNFHFVKGTALYTSNFTKPTTPIDPVANSKLLMRFTSAANLLTDSSGVNKTVTNVNSVTHSTTSPTWANPTPSVSSVNSSTNDGSYKAGSVISVQVNFSTAVTVSGTPQLTLETGTTDRTINYASGSGTTALTFTYTVQAGDTSVDLDYVSTSSLALNGGTIQNSSAVNATLTLPSPGAAGSLGANKAIVIDTTAPTVSSVNSSTGNASYGAGSVISIQVNFSEAVTVTGTPQLTLETGATDRTINYVSGTGTTALTFTYTVQAGDTSADLDYVGITSLALNGGTIRDLATNDAVLTLAAPSGANSLAINKAIVIDTTAPTVTGVTSSSLNGNFILGSSVSIQVNFSENVTVVGTPQLTLETGVVDRVVNYASGSTTSSLTFTYTVQSGDNTSDLDYTGISALALNSGTIRDLASNNATLTLPAPGAAGSLGANKAIVIDAIVPTVSSVTSSTADGTLSVGESVSIQVNLSEAVTVTGTPTLLLETGATDRSATFVSGSGTTTLNFSYTVQTGDTSADLNYVATTSLSLSGGTIKDALGNDATLTLPATSNASSLGGSKAIVIDTTAPTFSSAAVTTDGTQIILTYNSALSATTASSSAFTVTVAGSSATISTVATSGSTVVLTMAVRITTGQVVSFTYTDPTSGNDANAVQDLAGNDAATLGSTLVTNSSSITRPVFSAPTSGLTAIAGTAYSLTLTAATGGSGSGFVYTVATGTLPTGLTLSGRVISGTPTASGTFSGISITVTDSNSVTTTTATFTITVNRGSQLPISIATRFGTGGTALTLAIQGSSGSGALTYTLDPLVQSSCLLSGSVLTPNFAAGTSGTCYVKATRAADAAFTATSSATTAIFFTVYVPVIQQTLTCPAGTVPSAPTGIGVGSCIQVLAPVSSTPGDSGAAPKITALSATSGLVGARITITGTGFSTVTRVQFGTKSTTTFISKTSTEIIVDVPTGATRGRVMVVSPTGTAMAAQIFTVTVLDTQAPGFTGGSVNTSTPTQLTLNFDESIDGTGVLASSFAVTVNGSNRAITGISISGTAITLTLSSAVSAGQDVFFTYTSPGDSTSVKDATGNKTATITSTRLTNNVS